MLMFNYKGEKAVLLTTEDMQAVLKAPPTARAASLAQKYWERQLMEWKKLDIKTVLLVTSVPQQALPKYMRILLNRHYHCYVGAF